MPATPSMSLMTRTRMGADSTVRGTKGQPGRRISVNAHWCAVDFRTWVRVYSRSREGRRGRGTRRGECRDAALLRAAGAAAGAGAGPEWASPLRRGDGALLGRD